MTSDPTRIFVWAWLPGATDPVVCGAVEPRSDGSHVFTYGRSYLDRGDSIALFDMPLEPGAVRLADGLRLHGALRDALPDAWGQRVIAARALRRAARELDTGDLSEMRYMIESGSDRFGAIDFQTSPTHYRPRLAGSTTVDDLARAAADVDEGRPLPPAIAGAFEHGTSIGGARPKVLVADGSGHWIVKLSSTTDLGPRVRLEALGLDLARRCGLTVPEFELGTILGRDALWVRRFDREARGARLMAVSGLTLLRLDEMLGRYATYPDLVRVLTDHGAGGAGRELFTRLAVNIAVGNTDDHARNHAALWDGNSLRLSHAYDIDPCRPSGWDANQAMAYGVDGQRVSNLQSLVACHGAYGLHRRQAAGVVDRVVDTIRTEWAAATNAAQLTSAQAESLLGRIILAPGALD